MLVYGDSSSDATEMLSRTLAQVNQVCSDISMRLMSFSLLVFNDSSMLGTEVLKRLSAISMVGRISRNRDCVC